MAITETTITAAIPEWTMGDRVKKARKHAGLEQGDIADACGVSRALVSMWERDLAEPRISHVQSIADSTGIDFGWLVGAFRTGSLCTSPDDMDAMLVDLLASYTRMYGSV